MSDWTDAEYEDILGFMGGDDEVNDDDDATSGDDEPGVQSIALATTVDHTPLMTEVKD